MANARLPICSRVEANSPSIISCAYRGAHACWQGLNHHAPNWARYRVDHGTISGRSWANSAPSKPLFACEDCTFVDSIHHAGVQKKFTSRCSRAAQRGDVFYRAESYGFSSELMNYVRKFPVVPERGSCLGRALLERRVVHIPDVQADSDYTWNEAQRLGGFRTMSGEVIDKSTRSIRLSY